MKRLALLIAAFGSSAFAQERHEHGSTVFHRIDVNAGYSNRHDGQFDWDVHGWIGGDAERIWLRSEGESEAGRVVSAEAQIYYGWNVDEFWDLLVGLRHDFEPDSRSYAALSLVGMAPYFLETEASVFLSEDGDLSARLEQEVDLRLTQRLVLEPSWELNLSAQDVPELGTGAGLTDIELALQLRYEVAREFAPYVEIVWERKLGETASIARAAGDDAEETSIRAGVKVRF